MIINSCFTASYRNIINVITVSKCTKNDLCVAMQKLNIQNRCVKRRFYLESGKNILCTGGFENFCILCNKYVQIHKLD